MPPVISVNGVPQFPKIGKEKHYFDWRRITAVANDNLPLGDFTTAKEILNSAWIETISYYESKWKSELLPNI